jgi:hypothetical protein
MANNHSNKMNMLLKSFFLKAAEYGWFLDYNSSIIDLAELVGNNDEERLNQTLVAHFSNEVKAIEIDVLRKFQKRREILGKAFKAHFQGDYELSIPVFLSQIDGIFREMTTKEIFLFNAKKNPISWINDIDEEKTLKIILAILEPLKVSEILASNFTKSSDYPNVIHRNCILHGYDTTYANEINSYKVISLLNYVSTIVYDVVYSE